MPVSTCPAYQAGGSFRYLVERGSSKPVPVKLHIHGEWGEYLAPMDRHRILNLDWFEDYGVDYGRIEDWASRARVHACTYIPGETQIKLPLGRVYVEVSKGFEIRPIRRVVEVTAETQEIVIEIERVLRCTAQERGAFLAGYAGRQRWPVGLECEDGRGLLFAAMEGNAGLRRR